MGSEWTETTLGELCESQGGSIQTGPFGSQLHASDYQDAGTPVVMPVNLIDGRVSETGIARVGEAHVSRLTRHKLLPGDIVFSRRGDVTRFALITERESGWLCGTGCLKVSLGDQEVATAEFVGGILSLPESKEWLIQHAVGATMPNLNTSILSALPVRLPDLATQRSATSLLATLTARMESLRQTSAILEAIAQALFKSWFMDFEPVHAKSTGRDPEGMDAATAALFPHEFEDSPLGLIPKGWQVASLHDIVELKYGKALKASERSPGDIPVYGSGGVIGMHDTALINGPAIIVGRKGTVGSLYWRSGPCFPIDTVFYALPKRSLHFAYFAMQRMGLEQLNTDAAVPGLNRDNAHRQAVVLPPERLLSEWDELASVMRRRIDQGHQHAHSLREIRDTILPRLISGRLRFPEAEVTIKELSA